MKKRILIVGAGIGGLASAALLAREGLDVLALEKNEQTGGRARLWVEQGFQFDMGPSWYLMPEVFERFFSLFGKRVDQYYTLKPLAPYYKVFFGPGDSVEVGPDVEQVVALFERFESGGGERLRRYLEAARYKYDVAMREFLYRSYDSLFQFLNRRMLVEGTRLDVFGRLDRVVRRYFSDRRCRQILEYAMVFLGTSPEQAPGLYSIMSHVDLNLGVHYPLGGLAGVAQAVRRLAEEQGARILTGREVRRISVEGGRARAVLTAAESFEADAVLVNADYAHAELDLLEAPHRRLNERYWRRRVLAPSMFVLYLGLNRKLGSLAHHNLYFAERWEEHFRTIFRRPSWPPEPCFYVSVISKTDPDSAPPGGENVFVLVPVAPGLQDEDEVRERYAQEITAHLERITGEDIRGATVVRRIYSHRDFIADYHAYRGTALGLAHTLGQTAVFRPPFRSRRVSNLFFAGQYTHPGVGVPMVLIAAQVACGLIAGDRL
jgi:phytoene desaturase